MRRILHVVAAVIVRDGAVLACRRLPEKSAGGYWEFPGGKVEEGETLSEALRREISEELATYVRVLEELTTDDTDLGEVTIRLSCLRCELLGTAPIASTDHDRLEWVPTDRLRDLDWAAPDLPAVEVLSGWSNSTGARGSRLRSE